MSTEISDEQWLKAMTYYEMVDHFASGGPNNKFHNGFLGKQFSDLMDSKRATLTPEMIAEIQNNILKKMGNFAYKGVKH